MLSFHSDSSLPAEVAAAAPGAIRVLRIFSRLNIGGPSWHVILLTAGLEARGYETRLVIGREGAHEGNLLDVAERRGVRCITLEGLGREIRPFPDLRVLWELFRCIREFRPQIVHTHTAKAGVLGRLAATLARTPIVVHTFHGHVLKGYFGPVKSLAFRWIERLLAHASSVLIAVSEAVKKDLVELGVAPPSRIRVVPLGLDLERLAGKLPSGRLRAEAGFSPEAPLIGMVGRLVPIKDVSTFLRAAKRVSRQRPEVRFSLVGDGEEKAPLQLECAQLGLQDRVHFHGWKNEMDEVFGDLDLVVNSSRNEGTPVALIEALAASRPVIATAVGGTPDLLGPNRFGSLVPPGDPEALAEAILSALEQPEPARARALAGRRHVMETHSVDRLLQNVDGLYRELLRLPEKA